MAHSRKLVLSGVALVKARIAAKENAAAANLVRDDLEQTLIEVGYFEQAPFQWVGLIIRYGLCPSSDNLRQRVRFLNEGFCSSGVGV